MSLQNDLFRKQVLDSLKSGLKALYQTDFPDVGQLLTQAPSFEFGQAALPCHTLARTLKQSPLKIAEDIGGQFNVASNLSGYSTISRVEAVNGYVNFFCEFKMYGAELLKEIRSGAFFNRKKLHPEEREKISVEYSQPNTHKALHIGHLRNMVYGDAVCSLLEFAGHRVVRTTYPGDLGAHIAKCLWYIQFKEQGKLPSEGLAHWLGEIYAQSVEYLSALESPEKQAEALLVRDQIGEVLQALQEKRGEIYDLYLKTREGSLQEMRRIYLWLDLEFDDWYFESECDEPSRDLVLRKAEEGFFQKSDGAIGLDLSAYGLGFALYLKSDGNGLYLTKDLELIRRKFADPEVTRSIVVVDARQKLHFQQLFKTVELMGYPQAAKSIHLSYETVTTLDGKAYSSRALKGVQLGTLREQMEKKVIQEHLGKYRTGDHPWSEEDIQTTAQKVTLGALKYGMLKVDSSTVIRFDLDEWLKMEGETGPYLMYVHARCCSVLEKLGSPAAQFEIQLDTTVEQELLFTLGLFEDRAMLAASTYKPSTLTSYLYDLSKLFNRFYKECQIKNTTGSQKETRLALVEATAKILERGLGILGISAPARM